MKKKIITLICIIVFFVVAFISMIISVNLTGVLNPISTVYNLSKIMFDEDELYVVAQNKPWKIMFAKPYIDGKSAQQILDEYMKDNGYIMSDKMGSIITYKNEEGNEKRIHFLVNRYCSIWEWI